MEKFTAILKWWIRLYTINDDDRLWAILIKVVIRLIGIAIFIAISPLAIIGFIIGISFVF